MTLASWRIEGARVADGPVAADRRTLYVDKGSIAESSTGPLVDLTGALLLPGFINAHDHLEFALLPRLGQGPYRNAADWYADIYKPDQSPIRDHLRVSKDDRLLWGGLRNLVCGVTTVSHHNPYQPSLFESDFPVRVLRRQGWGHSVSLDRDLAQKVADTPTDAPFLIHLGEATDGSGESHLNVLDAMGGLGQNTVLVHAVDLSPALLRRVRDAGGTIVWCPSSNDFLLGQTLRPGAFADGPPICLGSDSPISAAGDWTDELHCAYSSDLLGSAELYEMIFRTAPHVLRIGSGLGTMEPGSVADVVALKDTADAPAEAMLTGAVELVLLAGRVKLVSHERAPELPPSTTKGLERLRYDGVDYLVDAPVERLLEGSREILGEIRLSGKSVSSW